MQDRDRDRHRRTEELDGRSDGRARSRSQSRDDMDFGDSFRCMVGEQVRKASKGSCDEQQLGSLYLAVDRTVRKYLSDQPYASMERVIKKKAEAHVSFVLYPRKPASASAAETVAMVSNTTLGPDVASLIGALQQEADVIKIVQEEVKKLIKSEGPNYKTLRSPTGAISDAKINTKTSGMINLVECKARRQGSEREYPLLHKYRTDVTAPGRREQLKQLIVDILRGVAMDSDDEQ